MAGRELLGRPDVDEDDVAVGEPGEQFGAADALDLVAEIVARGALDLGQPRGRDVAQRQPEAQRLVAGQRVADARCPRARG